VFLLFFFSWRRCIRVHRADIQNRSLKHIFMYIHNIVIIYIYSVLASLHTGMNRHRILWHARNANAIVVIVALWSIYIYIYAYTCICDKFHVIIIYSSSHSTLRKTTIFVFNYTRDPAHEYNIPSNHSTLKNQDEICLICKVISY